MSDAACRANTEITLLAKYSNGDIRFSVGSDCIVRACLQCHRSKMVEGHVRTG